MYTEQEAKGDPLSLCQIRWLCHSILHSLSSGLRLATYRKNVK